jgi:type IV pilus assembly protein PilN
MRTQINLATQPYEDATQYLVRWGSLLALLALITVGLIWFTVHSVRKSSDINHQLVQIRNNVGVLDREKATAERMLALPQNRGTVEKSQYLNEIFARKAFSWTTVFSDMEKLMPPGLHVLSIAPGLDAQNQLEVHIIVGGEKRERALELVRNMEQTPRFRDVMLRSDTTNSNTSRGQTTAGGAEERDLIKFDITARYVPGAAGASPGLENTVVTPPAEQSTLAEGKR